MRPMIALALLALAASPADPVLDFRLPPIRRARIRGFMPLWLDGKPRHDVQCIADEFMVPGQLCFMNDEGNHYLMATPETWAMNGAHNLASAYRPEGVP